MVANGKPLWSDVSVSKPSDLHLKLRQLEAGFDWKGFFQTGESHVPKFNDIDSAIEALNKKLTADMKKLPKKKVMIAEGFSQEMEDPDQMISLWKQHGADKQKAFEARYNKMYAWWHVHYSKLKGMAASLDEMAATAQSNDASQIKVIQPFLADVQIRTWEALHRLTVVSQRLFDDTLIARISEQQADQMIKMYTDLKATAR